MNEITGWLLDIYPVRHYGLALWLLGDDGVRHRFIQPFPVTFFAAGPSHLLMQLRQFLRGLNTPLQVAAATGRDIFQPQPLPTLGITLAEVAEQETVFQTINNKYPDLTYYNADIPISLLHAARYGSFPLARCRLQVSSSGQIEDFTPLDSPWELDPVPPPLRVLTIRPDSDPRQVQPRSLLLEYEQRQLHMPLNPVRPFLINLAAVLRNYDPDILLTAWGDNWLIPYLQQQSSQHEYPLPLNREYRQETLFRRERSYFSYGQVIYRDQQHHLYGRCHVDAYNATLFHDYGLDGIYELSRVTGLPLQVVARVSPGSGISAMQMTTALRLGILVPWHKQQAEIVKSATELLHADQGGLVYQPKIGLHANVAELDFISMYPSIMVHHNISPETTFDPAGPRLNQPPGLIPQTLAPLLEKRITIKKRLTVIAPGDSRRRRYKAASSAHKWLLVTCFGYLGYKNARFGRIEAHEAVTAYGREALLRAKESAEDAGFEVLHLYVDGMWAQRPDSLPPGDLRPLLDDINHRSGLPIALEGVYRWVAFLPSRLDSRLSVANRYFGVFYDGTIKTRGIEARRRDTPRWVAEIQMELLDILSQAPDLDQASRLLPKLVNHVNRALKDLWSGRIPLERLVVAQKLSRNLSEYRTQSSAARAAAQLEALGRSLRPGQMVRFVYVLGEPNVHAWELPRPPNVSEIDRDIYARLLLRAASTITGPFGADETALHRWIFKGSLPSLPVVQTDVLFLPLPR